MKDYKRETLHLIFLFLVPLFCISQTEKTSLEKANELLAQMTIEEKIGQMSQVDLSVIKNKLTDIQKYGLGSVLSGGDSKPGDNSPKAWADLYDSVQAYATKTRLKIPVIYGVDAVHGHNAVKGAVIYPHNVGLGCTRNPELLKKMGAATATAVAATGIDWNFGPCLAVSEDDRWGRAYESYSEDPQIVSDLAAAYVKGMQGESLKDNTTIATTIKHFAGDGATDGGKDRGNATMPEAEFMEKHVNVYKASIDAGAASVMASFSLWNGKECHGNPYLLNDILRKRLGFDGMIVSDWGAIDLLPGEYYSDIVTGINAGLDLIMVPIQYEKFLIELKKAIENGDVKMSRIDDAVRRILKLKYDLGLFEQPYTDRSLLNKIGCQEYRELGRQAVRESIVMLKNNNNTLPLSKNLKKIHVAGSHGDNLGYQCGGWTLSWQGLSGDITKGTTVVEAIKDAVPGAEVSYSLNGEGAQFGADVAVVVIGEKPYAEWFGDDQELAFDQRDIDVLANLKQRGIPIVCVLMTGRPLILEPILHYCDAIIEAWLPGTEGGGIADVLFGDYVPTGKLSFTWPKNIAQVPINKGDVSYDPLYPFGYGLTSFDEVPVTNPILMTAVLSLEGNSIELLFDQPIKGSPGLGAFNIVVDDNKPIAPSTIKLSETDKHKLEIMLTEKVREAEKISLSFNGKGIQSVNKKIVEPFTDFDVYSLQFSKGRVNKVPGMIQVENYYNQKNIDVIDANDELGQDKVIMEPGEWVELMIDVDYSNLYDMYFRFWSENKGLLEISIDDIPFEPVKVPRGSDYDWQLDAFKDVQLYSGKHTIKLKSVDGTIHINWMAFDTFRKLLKK